LLAHPPRSPASSVPPHAAFVTIPGLQRITVVLRCARETGLRSWVRSRAV